MKKLFFAIGMMAMMSAASAATAPAAGESQSPPPEPMGACIFSPCAGKTFCHPIFGNIDVADAILTAFEMPCILKEQGPPPSGGQNHQGPPRPAGGKH